MLVLCSVLAAVVGYAVGRYHRARAVRELLAAIPAAAGDRPGDVSAAAGLLTGLGDLIATQQHELDRARQELREKVRDTERGQRVANDRLRREAKQAVDDTGVVIRERLRDVVEQVGSVRSAATATREQVTGTGAVAAVMVRRVRDADGSAAALNASLQQVAGIAGVISQIASQTRMLALNATIEAARAGSAGKGFAVVADEVRKLAVTTAESTGQISSTVAGLESEVMLMSRTLADVVGDVNDIESAMAELTTIAGDQHTIVQRLDHTVEQTMTSIEDLSEVAERLERRRAYRMTVSGTVTLTTASRPEQTVVADLVDLSTGGLGCLITTATAIGAGEQVRAQIVVGGRRLELDARVVRHVPHADGSAEIGLQLQQPDPDTVRLIQDHLDTLETPAR